MEIDPEIQVALIAGLVSITTASIAAYFTAQKTISNRLTELEVKVDLLWKTYVVDAVKASRSAGMIASHSKISPTEKWEELLPASLKLDIGKLIERYSQYTHDPYDISIQVTSALQKELLEFSIQQNINMKVIIGGIYVLAENELDGS